MRLHISLDDDLVRELDQEVGDGERSAFIQETLQRELDRRRRWRRIWHAIEASPMEGEGHIWDPDPARYFHQERRRASEAREARLRKAWAEGG
jgi:hypothetical protein